MQVQTNASSFPVCKGMGGTPMMERLYIYTIYYLLRLLCPTAYITDNSEPHAAHLMCEGGGGGLLCVGFFIFALV